MKRRVIDTADGSKTILIEDWQEQYHSIHGAVQEAYHVFIKMGLHAAEQKDLSVLEMGFGTGLNALITFLEAGKKKLRIQYHGIEKYPVSEEELQLLNYVEVLQEQGLEQVFRKMHKLPWEVTTPLSNNFTLTKTQIDFRELRENSRYHLIYFDAFGPRVQPELWTVEIFKNLYNALLPNGILVTYSSTGSVRRAMEQCGFVVEKLPGPPGKREMLRAGKC